jgi:hypothetical protein
MVCFSFLLRFEAMKGQSVSYHANQVPFVAQLTNNTAEQRQLALVERYLSTR